MANKELAIDFLKKKNKKLANNFQIDIFSLENTGEYKKYKTDENYFKALNLSKGIDEILEDLGILDLINKHKHIFLYAIFINQNNYCGQENTELEKRDKFKEEINKIKEYLENGTHNNR